MDARQLLDVIPDRPRWVFARGMLRTGRAEVMTDAKGSIISSRGLPIVCIVGEPDDRQIDKACRNLYRAAQVITAGESSAHVAMALPPDFEHSRGHVYASWTRPASMGDAALAGVRLVNPSSPPSSDHLPTEMRSRFVTGVALSPAVAVMEEKGLVQAYCFGIATETHVAVCLETNETHRGKGLGQRCLMACAVLMRARGYDPVWIVSESSPEMQHMATKLGLKVVDEVTLFHR